MASQTAVNSLLETILTKVRAGNSNGRTMLQQITALDQEYNAAAKKIGSAECVDTS